MAFRIISINKNIIMAQQYNGTLIKRLRKEQIVKLKYRDKGYRNRLIKHNSVRIFKDFINVS